MNLIHETKNMFIILNIFEKFKAAVKSCLIVILYVYDIVMQSQIFVKYVVH